MSYSDVRARAREQLGGAPFGQTWLMSGVVCLIVAAISALVGSIIPYIGSVLLVGLMNVAMSYIFLEQARNQKAIELSDVFREFNSEFLEDFLLGLMYMLFIFLWSLLFVIPGIVKAYSYSMCFFIKADNPTWKWKECLDESVKITEGKKMDLFVLDLTFIGWILLSVCTCGISIFWIAPYMQAARTQVYEDIARKM